MRSRLSKLLVDDAHLAAGKCLFVNMIVLENFCAEGIGFRFSSDNNLTDDESPTQACVSTISLLN